MLAERRYIRHVTDRICQGAQQEDDDRNDDTRMLSDPVADDMGLYLWKKGGPKACVVNVEAVYDIASNDRGTKVRKGDGGSTVRCASDGSWG